MKIVKVEYYGVEAKVPEYEAVSKEYAKGLIDVSERMIKHSKELSALKKVYKDTLDKMTVRYPEEVRKYRDDIKYTLEAVREEKKMSEEEVVFYSKRMSPTWFINNVNRAYKNLPLVENWVENAKAGLENITLKKSNVKSVVDGYCYLCLECGMVNNMKRELGVTIQRTEFILNKKGYAEEAAIEEKETKKVAKTSKEKNR